MAFERLDPADRTLAVVFGLASVPWTYVFVVGGVPLWPSFIASGSFYAADESVAESYAANALGIAYAALTLAAVARLSTPFGGPVVLSLLVGVGMFVASLHGALRVFVPGGFFGYATLFSVHAAGATAFGLEGLPGETVAAALSMLAGAVIGLATARARDRLTG